MELTWMLAHEIALAERYRRFVTLLMLQPNQPERWLAAHLQGKMRQSDVIFDFDGSRVAVLMSETAPDGARTAIDRYLREFPGGSEVTYGFSSYPEDGNCLPTLLAAATRRLGSTKGEERRGKYEEGSTKSEEGSTKREVRRAKCEVRSAK
jgi:hypothetical protein